MIVIAYWKGFLKINSLEKKTQYEYIMSGRSEKPFNPIISFIKRASIKLKNDFGYERKILKEALIGWKLE